jgi:dienelactone hydrolase
MAEVLLFHHRHGLTPGVRSFAETLEQAGHTVHVPDLYKGRVFETLDEGAAYAEQAGFDTIIERAAPSSCAATCATTAAWPAAYAACRAAPLSSLAAAMAWPPAARD